MEGQPVTPSLLPISASDGELLQKFLEGAGTATQSFRYFDKRPFTVLKQHVSTFLLMVGENKPVAYGHLDEEGGIVWLGIAVSEGEQGKGYGKVMMDALIEAGKENDLSAIRLSVDKDNPRAKTLYQKYGFSVVGEKPSLYFMEYQY